MTIYEGEAGLVSEMREYHQLRQTFGNAKGSIDLTGWLRAEAKAIVEKTDPECAKAALGHCDRLHEMFVSAAAGASLFESVEELQRATPAEPVLRSSKRPRASSSRVMRREAERMSACGGRAPAPVDLVHPGDRVADLPARAKTRPTRQARRKHSRPRTATA